MPSAPAKLCVDSKSAISVAKNPEHHGRIKHLDLCFYWLRDQVKLKQMQPIYLNTEDMPADLEAWYWEKDVEKGFPPYWMACEDFELTVNNFHQLTFDDSFRIDKVQQLFLWNFHNLFS